jgi:uncharacterized protein
MLIGFSVANFRSFHAKQSVNFVASSDDTHRSTHCMPTGYRAIPLLNRTAVVFGPNASGKTNLFIALRTMRDLVLNSTTLSESQFRSKFSPFGFNNTNALPTEFEVDLLLDGSRYKYALSYDAARIVYERLTVYTGRKPQRWFERRFDADAQSEKWAPFSVNVEGQREMWRKATGPRALFVTTAAQLDGEQFTPLLRWFQTQLEIVLSSSDHSDYAALIRRMRDKQFKHRILNVLQAVNIPIDDIRLIERDDMSETSPSAAVEVSYALAGVPHAWVNLDNEAAGVQRLFFLLGPLLDTIQSGKLAIIDNFDAALHPLVTRFLLQLNSEKLGERQQAQLLLSSHNTALMDLDILRRDEIWLMDTDRDHSSKLASMSKYHLRRREMIAKYYLRGRYGAVPVIEGVE